MKLDFSALKDSKNLLAFSAGIDSSALFYLLHEQNIPFDIAIVDYNLREESKYEVSYAKELASKYDKKIFIKSVNLPSSNFEKNARDTRYSFFEEIIKDNNYNTLITAHQLNDKLEWFLMQLSKGAGLSELIGLNELEEKTDFRISRPLLNISKDELEDYLKQKNIKYFIDKSNYDEKYKRNYFRHNFSDKFIKEYKNGVKNSFEYLQNDLDSLNISTKPTYQTKQLEIFENRNDDNLNIRTIDIALKKRGLLLSKASRDEIIKQRGIVVSHKIAISITSNYIWISPYEDNSNMDKKFKELCRVNKIPTNIRAYLYKEKIDLSILTLYTPR